MPGILPMKVIKVGTTAQARIAQACDRCRSKKIRCDGVRPCCTQCANVGFECKTSDKLSRRAFPRGYTESLEERVRALELEVRELKDLLDEKDEKIDMLSRIHSQSSHPIQLPSPRRPSITVSDLSPCGRSATPEETEVFKVQQSPYLLADDGADSYFAGTSSGRTFVEAFKRRVQEGGRSTTTIETERLLPTGLRKGSESPLTPASPVVWRAPPRLVSDQLVNIFFQEWAPLFPVLHRPTFLNLYEKYVADAESVTDKTAIAQLNLVFGIATLSGGTRSSADLESFESQWKAAVDTILTENTMQALQVLILAQIYCIQQGDLAKVITYKGLSTTLSARLGLHQSQKRFALGTLTCETRKKVFWTLYTVDCFTAVVLGLPKHLKDEDVQCEYPVDADDEYVTERGFQPTLPGDSTKLSSALALFRATRILSKVLEEVFPARASYDLSMKTLSDLSDELDAWCTSLAPHLRLQFTQDKPSTGTISSRSPLLSLTYHYIRALLHRPAICASIGNRSSSSMIMLASSCKHIIQILQLLDERGLGFSFCLNKDEVLVLSGFGLLFQGLNLDPESKILKDNHKMMNTTIEMLTKSRAPCAPDFTRVAQSFLPAPSTQTVPNAQSAPEAKVRHDPDPSRTMTPHESLPSSTRKQLKAIASRFTSNSKPAKVGAPAVEHRRATVHHVDFHAKGVMSQSQSLLPPAPTVDAASLSRSEPALSPVNMYNRRAPSMTATPQPKPQPKFPPHKLPNLDYLSFGDEVSVSACSGNVSRPIKTEPQPTDWEKLLGSLDNGQANIYDACYGGPAINVLLDPPPATSPTSEAHTRRITTATAADVEADDNVWASDIWALCQAETNPSAGSGLSYTTGHPDSLLSFSTDEGRSSVEDWNSAASSGIGGGGDAFRGIVMPADVAHDDLLGFGVVGWDSVLNM